MAEKPIEETPETPKKEETPGKEEETPKVEGTPEKEGTPKEPEKKEEEAGDKKERTPRLMPAWQHKIAEDNWGKEKEGFAKTISDLEANLEAAKASPDRDKLIQDYAEKSGMEPENVKNFLQLAGLPLATIKKELDDLKTIVKKSDEDRLWAKEDKAFEEDFEKNLSSVLDTDKIPQENRARLKELLKTYAFTTEYSGTPLSVIYRGVEDFRQFLEKGVKKSGEPGKGGIRGGAEGEIDWLNLPPDEFEKKMKEMKAEGPGMEIRRDGRAISD